MLKSLLINEKEWEAFFLSEQALTISPKGKFSLNDIHQAFRVLEGAGITGLVDIIPAYESIALIFEGIVHELSDAVDEIQKAIKQVDINEFETNTIEVPVCYKFGLDWEEVEANTALSQKEIIEIHSSGTYTVSMMGFQPGFLYLSGLHEALSCPRKTNPRTKIPAGSVGIGGSQTGIYAMESPGGWQIIGRTPKHFFDVLSNPPIQIRPGDRVRFTPITEQQFTEWED